jgi:polar amino acid transport system ATP-binding protein
MNSDVVVEARGLHTRLGGTEVLCGVSLSVARGEVVAVLGPSGGGKTTFLRALNYLTPFSAGEVQIAGHRLIPGLSEGRDAALLRAVRLRAGMVFQQFHLFPHLTVLGNLVEAPQRVLGLTPADAEARARELLDRVGLAGHTLAFPRTLSGGQQQRVAIARALMMEPSVLLLDEPTSALDPRLVGEVLAVIRDLAASGQTMIIVTHQVRLAAEVAARVVVLAEGRIAESGRTEEVLRRPQSAAARELLAQA